MRLPLTGGCQCGKIRYAITDEPQLVYACHCTECQRATSSAFSMGLVLTEGAFRLSGAEPRSVQRATDSGRTTTRWVCSECAHGFAAVRNPARQRRIACAWCGRALSMILRGFGQRRTTGPAANNPGLRCPRGTASSRPNLRTGAGREMEETKLEKLARLSGKATSKALDALGRHGFDLRGKLSAPVSRVPRRAGPEKPKSSE
jgi:hypothetical protein